MRCKFIALAYILEEVLLLMSIRQMMLCNKHLDSPIKLENDPESIRGFRTLFFAMTSRVNIYQKYLRILK